MMSLRVERLKRGAHAREVVVSVRTKEGREQLTVDPQSVRTDAIEVGWPLGTDGRFRLVQLPRQTARGSWRVWVEDDELNVIDRRREDRGRRN